MKREYPYYIIVAYGTAYAVKANDPCMNDKNIEVLRGYFSRNVAEMDAGGINDGTIKINDL